jgi:predicted double-glycine peptidase
VAQFRLLNQTRQSTEYSCGASALRSVLTYWGRDVDEAELMKLLGTTSDEGTYPEDLVRGAHALGFEAEAKENLALDDVAQFTAKGDPMIALGQFWRSQRNSPASVVEDWENGHYVVVLGVDKDCVYFQDPNIRMSKAFVPRKACEAHWHQVMCGDLANNPELIHLGIFVRGEKPAPPKPIRETGITALDFRKMGSLNLIVTQFRGVLLPFDLLDERRDLWKNDAVRLNAFIFLRKDQAGNVSGMEGSGLQEEKDMVAVNALLAAITSRSVGGSEVIRSKMESAVKAAAAGDFGLSADDIRKIADKLPPDHSAIIGLFENVWERRFKEVAGRHAGEVINQRLITPEALARVASELIAADSAAGVASPDTGS